jgi:hypothetical protein
MAPRNGRPQQVEEPEQERKQSYFTRKYNCPNGGMIVLDVDFKEKQTQNGQAFTSWYAKVRKIYRDSEGKWQSTDFLSCEEMLIAAAALQYGAEIIVSARNQT